MRYLIVSALLFSLAACGGKCVKDDDTVSAGDVAGVQDTAVPAEDTAIPEEDTAIPEEDTAVPEEDTNVPDEDIAVEGDTGGQLLSFGEACTQAPDCFSGVCHEFGDGAQLCTIACQDDAGCPEGSQGAKCNNKGVCKP